MSATILVVDDNPTNLKLVSNVLELEGYQILRAADAEEAQTLIATTPPQLILMDIALPGMDGLTLTRKLKADEKTRHIRVIALTAFAMRGDDKKAFEAGCDGYITKPIDTRRLPTIIADQLRPSTPVSAKRILLVDDNQINRKLLRAILEAEGHVVIEAVDGLEAMTLGDPGQIEAIISDILMPNMDGYRFCYEIRRRERWRNIPFIFYTSTYTSDDDERLALEIGADAYLRKPSSANVISETLSRVLKQERPTQSTRPFNESDVLKEYSERLVAKLEERNTELMKKTAELEFEVARRKKADENRDKVEALLRRAQRMEALGTLASGVAHDFSSIINAVAGNAELALQDMATEHPSRRSIAEIIQATTRARDLVSRILSFSREQNTRRESIALAPVVDEAIQLLRVTFPPSLQIKARHAADLPPVMADASQIHQMVINLANNAKHAMNDQGSLDISTAMVTIAAGNESTSTGVAPGRYVQLAVADTGCGMDRATIDRIFDPFFTTKPVGEGTGLGLSVVHGVMKAHDGEIAVDSEKGRGTTFRLLFRPAGEASPTSTAKRAASPPARSATPTTVRGNGERILLVDDDKSLVYLMSRMLERLGYRISGFTDAREALDAFRAAPNNFDLIIADWFMPGMPGIELARQLIAIRPSAPVVIATGVSQPNILDQARRVGIRDVIPRPTTAAEWSETLGRLLSSVKGAV